MNFQNTCGVCGSRLHYDDQCDALELCKDRAAKIGTRYVAGFMFDPDRKRVALIRKAKPTWQAGKLNGIGGKVESVELPFQAMCREFQEETGCKTMPEDWQWFCRMGGTNDCGGPFYVDFFVAVGELGRLQTQEAEQLEVIHLDQVSPLRTDMIENLVWLLALALDFLHDGRPRMVSAYYGTPKLC